MSRLEDAVGVCPLAQCIEVIIDTLPVVRGDVLGQHIHAHIGYGIGYLVLNERVSVIGTRR